jgi:hypothetical protein
MKLHTLIRNLRAEAQDVDMVEDMASVATYLRAAADALETAGERISALEQELIAAEASEKGIRHEAMEWQRRCERDQPYHRPAGVFGPSNDETKLAVCPCSGPRERE